MCCATKNALISVILWLLALIGLAPVTPGLIDSMEQWVSHEQSLQPAIHTYASIEEIDLRAFVFVTDEVDSAHPQPAAVTAFRANASQSMPRAVLGICSDLAELGYVAIAFETPSEQDDGFGHEEGSDTLQITTWLNENADELGVDISRTAVITVFGQPVLDLQLDWDLNSQENAVEHKVIILPEGAERFPSELVPLLPSLL